MEILAEKYEGKPLSGPNDVTIDGQGRLYFTDSSGAAVYRIDAPGKLVRILSAPDILLPGWRRQVRNTSDLGDMLASAINRPATTDVAAAAARYDAATLRAAEEARDRAQQVRVAELRRRFVDGPVLTMPSTGSGASNTTGSVGIEGVGAVLFGRFTLSAQWGRLTADGGVLRAVGGATVSVPVTRPLEGSTLQGDGWSGTLNSGWVVRPAARPGSFSIVREN